MGEELIHQPDGATPLSPEDLEGLIPGHIRTRRELDEWENRNVLKARTWAMSRRRQVLDEEFAKHLHRRMFNETWEWAGQYRKTEKNIGIAPEQLHQGAVRNLCEDTKARLIAGEGVADAAIWFHHRLTVIHPFANGNGRHARLITELLLLSHDHAPFTWGMGDLSHAGDVSACYINALQEADKGDFRSLKKFVRLSGN